MQLNAIINTDLQYDISNCWTEKKSLDICSIGNDGSIRASCLTRKEVMCNSFIFNFNITGWQLGKSATSSCPQPTNFAWKKLSHWGNSFLIMKTIILALKALKKVSPRSNSLWEGSQKYHYQVLSRPPPPLSATQLDRTSIRHGVNAQNYTQLWFACPWIIEGHLEPWSDLNSKQ